VEQKLLTLKETSVLTGLSEYKIYQLINKRDFPAFIQLGERTRRWKRSEILNWMEDVK